MSGVKSTVTHTVHCRIGSLENVTLHPAQIFGIHCRIDSQKNSVETAV